jgi:hypothetical protein
VPCHERGLEKSFVGWAPPTGLSARRGGRCPPYKSLSAGITFLTLNRASPATGEVWRRTSPDRYNFKRDSATVRTRIDSCDSRPRRGRDRFGSGFERMRLRRFDSVCCGIEASGISQDREAWRRRSRRVASRPRPPMRESAIVEGSGTADTVICSLSAENGAAL